MICGLAAHGLGHDAVELFEKFVTEGFCPTSVTFVGVLNACSRTGPVDKGRSYFRLMSEKYGIESEMEHYGCMVDLLSRAGLVQEAVELIEGMRIAPDPVLWGTILSACKRHGLVDLGITVGNKLIELEPAHDGHYVLLASIYATAKKWDEVRKVRKLMSNRGTNKSAGWSMIEAHGILHRFLVGDMDHKDSVQIYNMLGMIDSVTVGEGKKRVNCLFIEEEALWAIYIEYKRITPNPRLGDMTILPLTPPPQMQRECNVVAFEEWY